MERWGFYVSGIQFGILEKENGQIFHQPLNVYTGEFCERESLTENYSLYQEMGKMNVLEALSRMDTYEKGISEGAEKFETVHGEIFTKKSEGEYTQRIVKFPKFLMVENGTVFAVLTSYRDQCAVLVKEGFEEKTILKTWNEKYSAPLYNMKEKETIMVPMRDGVRLRQTYIFRYVKRKCRLF